MKSLNETIELLKKNLPENEEFTLSIEHLNNEKELFSENIKWLCDAISKNNHIKECKLFLKSPYNKNIFAILEAINLNQSLIALTINVDNFTSDENNSEFTAILLELIKLPKFSELCITIKKIDFTHLTLLFNAIHTHSMHEFLSLVLPLKSMNDKCFEFLTSTIYNNKLKMQEFRIAGNIDNSNNENMDSLDFNRFKTLCDALGSLKCKFLNLAHIGINRFDEVKLQYLFKMLLSHLYIEELSLSYNNLADLELKSFLSFTHFLQKINTNTICLTHNNFSEMNIEKKILLTNALKENMQIEENAKLKQIKPVSKSFCDWLFPQKQNHDIQKDLSHLKRSTEIIQQELKTLEEHTLNNESTTLQDSLDQMKRELLLLQESINYELSNFTQQKENNDKQIKKSSSKDKINKEKDNSKDNQLQDKALSTLSVEEIQRVNNYNYEELCTQHYLKKQEELDKLDKFSKIDKLDKSDQIDNLDEIDDTETFSPRSAKCIIQ